MKREMAMDESAVGSNASSNEEDLSSLLENNADQVDMLLARYKYHVLKSAMGAENKKALRLVEDVRNKSGEILLAKGTVDSESSLRHYISKLIAHDLEHPIEYYIGVIQPEIVGKIHTEMNQIADALSQRGVCDFENIKEIIDEVVLNLGNNHILLNRLAVFKGEYPSGFNESLATAIIATSVGQEAGYRFEERVETFTAGLFHHIGELPVQHLFGKHKIPYEEVKKIKGHPLAGYLILSSKDISPNVKNAVLKHHLFPDGSGYPTGLSLTVDDDLAKLINISSSLVTMCSRGKRSLKTALKLLDIYSRFKTRCGDTVTPLYDRSFYEILQTLNLSVIEGGDQNPTHTIDEIRALHNTYVKLNKINANLATLITRMQTHAKENHIPKEVGEEIDALLSYAGRMKNLTSDTNIIIGADQLMKAPAFAAELMVDMEVIITELGHYLSYFEKSIQAVSPSFENTPEEKLIKRARHILNQIRYQLPKKIIDLP
jgi:HD-GYP domain-containing protein (c-di-GMP phosphodiesterase class II)